MVKVKFKTHSKSSRELRRIAERERGREQRQQAINAFWQLSPEERARRIADNEAFKRISKNGITIEDMHKVEEEAFVKGVTAGKEETVRTCFAAFCMTMHELHGLDSEQCMAALNDTYDRLCFTINSQDAIQEVYDVMGLEIKFNGDITDELVSVKE